MIKILFAKTDAISAATIQANGYNIPAREIWLLQTIKDISRQIQRYVARVLLQELIQSFQLEKSLSLTDLYYENGKPLFRHGLNFSISHAEGLTVCAAAGNTVVGIDVEKITMIDLNLYQDYFKVEEWQEIKEDHSRFWVLWTRKEAMVKATGIGLEEQLNLVPVLDNETTFRGNKFYYNDLSVGGTYQCQLVSTLKQASLNVSEFFIK